MTHKNSATYPKQTLRNEISGELDSDPIPRTIEILGVKINLVDYKTTLTLIKDCISRQLFGRYICACPVHPIIVSQRDHELRMALNNSWLTVPDGVPVVWAARFLGGKIKKNVRGTDLVLYTCQMAEKNDHSVFLYGSKQKTLNKLKKVLIRRYPRLRIVGSYSPPFRELTSEEKISVTQMINLKSPDILFVGLGAPKQEKWMATFCSRINVPITLGVGAAFDFLSGERKQAPVWMQVRGLEWLFRLVNEPHRLWARYIVYNPLFVLLFLKQLLRSRLFQTRLTQIK